MAVVKVFFKETEESSVIGGCCVDVLPNSQNSHLEECKVTS